MRNDSSGLGLPPVALGEVLLPQSLVIMCMPLAYPILSRRFGHTGCYHVGAANMMLFSICLPMLRYVSGNQLLLWAGLLLISTLRGTVGPLIYPSMTIIVNQAVDDNVGLWNGAEIQPPGIATISPIYGPSAPCTYMYSNEHAQPTNLPQLVLAATPPHPPTFPEGVLCAS